MSGETKTKTHTEKTRSPIETLEQTTGLKRDELIDRLLIGAYSEGSLPSASVLLSGQRG